MRVHAAVDLLQVHYPPANGRLREEQPVLDLGDLHVGPRLRPRGRGCEREHPIDETREDEQDREQPRRYFTTGTRW